MLPTSRLFIEERMGRKYVEGENIDFSQSYEESGPSTPIFFILSPGVDPLKVTFRSYWELLLCFATESIIHIYTCVLLT